MKLNKSNVNFNPVEHTYKLDGEYLSGITGIIMEKIFPDMFKFVSSDVLENKRQQGIDIHKELMEFDVIPIADTPLKKEYKRFKDDLGADVLHNEYVVSDNAVYASPVDKIALMNGKLALVDVKATYALNKEYVSWQLSIYNYLFGILNPDVKPEIFQAWWVKDGYIRAYDIELKSENDVKSLLYDPNWEYIDDRIATVDSPQALMLVEQITSIAEQIKQMKSAEKEFKQRLDDMFNDMDIKKWETDSFTITKSEDYVRESFNTRKFKQDNPELYRKYVGETNVKGSIRVKLK